MTRGELVGLGRRVIRRRVRFHRQLMRGATDARATALCGMTGLCSGCRLFIPDAWGDLVAAAAFALYSVLFLLLSWRGRTR